jgi:hypothetical protein
MGNMASFNMATLSSLDFRIFATPDCTIFNPVCMNISVRLFVNRNFTIDEINFHQPLVPGLPGHPFVIYNNSNHTL